MFVFNTEQCPYAPAAHFRKADEEAEERGVLQLAGEDGVENPVETEYRVEDHGEVINPGSFVAKNVTQKRMFGVRVAET